MTEDLKQKNAKLVRILAFVVVGMFGFGFALVPLYDVLCEVTGLNGKVTQESAKEKAYTVDNNREITVEFLTTVNKVAPLKFYPQVKQLKIHPGKYYTVNFFAENLTDKAMIAQAIPSISPGLAAEYFHKTECFCFTQQIFKAKETKEMPVRFAVDPRISGDYKTITLAYTFFDNTETSQKK